MPVRILRPSQGPRDASVTYVVCGFHFRTSLGPYVPLQICTFATPKLGKTVVVVNLYRGLLRSYAPAACFSSDWVRETGRSTRRGPRLGHGDSIWPEQLSHSGVHGHPGGAKRTRPRNESWRMTGRSVVFRSPILPYNVHQDSANHAMSPRTARALQKGDPAGGVRLRR